MSARIHRDPETAAARDFDLIVVGGGIHGIMVALEATRRRLRPLLLERGDFAAATSHNSLRILHGGLRYLQSLDLGRSRESIAERSWWIRNFPDLVRPLPCLMPLYDEGLRRPAAMRAALLINDALRRMSVGREDDCLGRGSVLDPDEVSRLFPAADRAGLTGGALWYDLEAPSTSRLCMEALRWACHEGAVALNHVEVVKPLLQGGGLAGVEADDQLSGTRCVFRAPVVVTATGPWTRNILGDDLLPAGGTLLAWNLLLRRPPPSTAAIALKARRSDAQTFFLVPRGPWLLAGTGYDGEESGTIPSDDALAAFIDGLNEAMPGLRLVRDDVVRVYAGRLDAMPGGAEPYDRATIVDAGERGGLAGLYGLTGPKLTTARASAAGLLDRAFPGVRPAAHQAFRRGRRSYAADEVAVERWLEGERLEVLVRLAGEEAAFHLDDLLLRRTPLGDRPWDALRVAPQLCRAFGWSDLRRQREIDRLRDALAPPARPIPPWLQTAEA